MAHRVIGVLSPELGGEYFGGLLRGINAAARERGALVVAVQTIDTWLPPSQHRKIAFDCPVALDTVDGWVVIVNAASELHLRELQRLGKPVISVSGSLPGVEWPTIHPDNHGGIEAATRHLIAHGHRRIGFAGLLHQADFRARYEGYQETLRQHGIEPDPALVFETEDNLHESGRGVGRLLVEQGFPCTAVLAGDYVAIGIAEALQAAGYSIPGSLALIGFDDVREAQQMQPALSSVRQDYGEIGRTSASLLLDQLEGQVVPPVPHYVRTSLVVRESCGCLVSEPAVPEGESLERDLARQLVEMALNPLPVPEDQQPEEIWPGVTTIVDALRKAVAAGQLGITTALREAWQQAIAFEPSVDTMALMVNLLARVGAHLCASQPNPARSRAWLDTFISRMYITVMRTLVAGLGVQQKQLEELLANTYEINLDLLGAADSNPADLEWLSWTPLRWGCFALWDEGGRQGEQLTILGRYTPHGDPAPAPGARVSVQGFPPRDVIVQALAADPSTALVITPVTTKAHEYGFLAIVGPVNRSSSSLGRVTVGQYAAQLAAAIERSDLVEKLQEAREAAEHASELKTKFLANMSHELRTPLNAIINFGEFIGQKRYGPLTERQQDLKRRIISNAEHLLGLINDILDLAKIEAGRMDLVCEEVDLAPLINGVMSTAIGLTKDKGLKLELEMPRELPMVWVDQIRIRQVLLNLLSNAAKFTEQGGITVRVREIAGSMIEIAVQDTGIGIAPENQHLVFEEFRQIQDDLTREYQGTGLGLPISRKLITMHGGEMWLKSALGVGSTIFFTIPIHTVPALPEGADEGPLLAPLVVVVDDDRNSQHILTEYLSPYYRVHSVLDSRLALETIRALKPRLILLDVIMPYIDGWTVLTELRNDPALSSIPVIMCSISDETRLGVALGANAHISKPLRSEDVVATVEHWVGAPSNILIVDDHEDARLVLRGMLEGIGCTVYEAVNGVEGLKRLDECHPDLLILDLMMPQMDGFEVLRRLRTSIDWHTLPVVIVTAKDLSADERQWLQEQSQLCVQKSQLSQMEFVSYVQRLVSREKESIV